MENIHDHKREMSPLSYEKNVRRMIGAGSPALPGPQERTPKPVKQIRFDLGDGLIRDMNTTFTPSPKEFKRMNNQRKTLRSARCMSTIVTEKERAILQRKQEDRSASPRIPNGIVQSMCRLYADNFGSTSSLKKNSPNGTINRSHSFNSPGSPKVSSGQYSPNSDNLEIDINESPSPSETSSHSPTQDQGIAGERKGSFRLFRSRSWSFKKKSNSSPSSSSSPNEVKRCSPSYSTKSQDSGFSDSGESHTQPQGGPRSSTSSSLPEEESNPVAHVQSSIGNIASLQEGLRLKREIFEESEKARNPHSHLLSHSASNLFVQHVNEEEEGNKASKQFYLREITQFHQQQRSQEFHLENSQLSETLDDASPMFSTPVRASFRRRPRSMIEEARTPSKIDSRIRLREVKAKHDIIHNGPGSASRRWSNLELAAIQGQMGPGKTAQELSMISEPRICDRSDIPEGIEPSLVAVYSQYMNYEPTLTDISLHKSYNHTQKEQMDYLPGLPVDGTTTQLMMESFNNQQLQDTSALPRRILAPVEQSTLLSTTDQVGHGAIIELETSGSSDSNNRSLHHQQQQYLKDIQEITQHHYSPSSGSRSHSSSEASSFLNSSPVDEWWRDLHVWCEPECMTYLQSKPILQHEANSKPFGSSSNQVQILDTNQMIEIIRKLQRGARAVHVTFNALNNHFCAMNLIQISKTLSTLMTQVQEFIFEYNLKRSLSSMHGLHSIRVDMNSSNVGWDFPGLKSRRDLIANQELSKDAQKFNEILLLQQRTVLQIVDRLKLCAHRCQYTPQQPLAEIKRILAALDKGFNNLVDMMLSREMQLLIRELDTPSSEISLRSALNTVILLGNEGSNHLCSLLAREGGVRCLLRHCHLIYSPLPSMNNLNSSQSSPITVPADEIRILALRGLSSICCVAECIREFEQRGGLKVIHELLCTRQSSMEDRIESAGVLAQITSPWISDNHKINNLDSFTFDMVASLTDLARLNGGEETFLLVTAALANLTFMSPMSSAAMKRCTTVKILVKAVEASPFTTLFAKDQVVTVLANMAANSNCRHDICSVRGVEFLLSMLDTKVNAQLNQAELAAAERVQKKAAIALSRLCNSPEVCMEVIQLGGIDRLVELCKDTSERNYSDAVLVACLAVLRRLKANLNNPEMKAVFDDLNASDLIQPKLVDSFLEYSVKQESYV